MKRLIIALLAFSLVGCSFYQKTPPIFVPPVGFTATPETPFVEPTSEPTIQPTVTQNSEINPTPTLYIPPTETLVPTPDVQREPTTLELVRIRLTLMRISPNFHSLIRALFWSSPRYLSILRLKPICFQIVSLFTHEQSQIPIFLEMWLILSTRQEVISVKQGNMNILHSPMVVK